MRNVNGLAYGGDYNPEQWSEEVWAEDAALMRYVGVNLVTVGVFSWARLEPEPGRYDLDWLAHVVDLLWEHGIAVDLATGTASPPAWLVRAHPEVLPVTREGVRLEFGSRQHYCPSSPVFRDKAVALATRVAERFGDHPGLALWHVSNEYGDESHECFCEVSAEAFRSWLRHRYDDVDGLNRAWGTDFWSQHYTDFAQVAPPRAAPGPINPTQQLDWRRFSSDTMLECFQDEKDVLNRLSPRVPVTTNFMGMFKYLDYWKWAAAEDLVSDDAYPDPSDPGAHITAAMNYDLMRSLRGADWLLMEQAPSAVSWREVNVPKTPDQYSLWSLQAVARGARGVMHFQWRASKAGAEKFHSAMLPHGGTESGGWRTTEQMEPELRALAPVAGTPTVADTAILLDWDSWWALEIDQHPSALLRWKDLVSAWYDVLWNANVAVDFVPVDADLSKYRTVLAPNLYLVDAATAARLKSYVESGGTLVCGFFSGIVDGNDHVHPGGHPGALRDLLGLTVDEFWPLPDGETATLRRPAGPQPETAPHGTLWRDWIVLAGAESVVDYAERPLAGRPAVTRHRHGSGTAWYVSTLPDPRTLARLFDEAGVTGVPSPSGVEVCRRGDFLFVLNHSGSTAEFTLPDGPRVDLLTGERIRDRLTLGPDDVACLA
ncbi:MAG: beta-galactosidase, partial [Stackebrandtia sp.]